MHEFKVLILDDSLVMRENLQCELERDRNLKIVAKCADAFEARDEIIKTQPDILVVDILMEKMDGLTFVKKLLPQYPIPVVMISTDHSKAAEVRGLPDVRFVPKPGNGTEQPAIFFSTVLANIKSLLFNEGLPNSLESLLSKVILIGASTGGAEALYTLLGDLPAVMPPIIVAQHMPARFTTTFANRLNSVSRLSVKEASDRDLLVPSQVLIAPGGQHTTVHAHEGRLFVSCREKDEKDTLACPNIDMLFQSMADLISRTKLGKAKKTLSKLGENGNTVGVILTGMGRDGAEGLLALSQNGAVTIGQDRQSSVVYGMPKSAFEMNAVNYQLPLNQIGRKLIELSKRF